MTCASQRLIVTEKPYEARLTVFYGETWYDPLPQLIDPVTGDPWDITGVTIQFILRPSADYATRFAAPSVIKEDAVNGLAAVFWSQTNVEANLPLSQVNGWWHMQRLSFTDPILGPVRKILAEGPLFVLPARDTATP